MNFVVAALVYHSYSSEDALKIVNHLMRTGYRKLFLDDLSYGRMVASKLTQDMRRLIYDLYSHLTEEGVDL